VTGGYLFHRRLAERAARHDAEISFVSIPDLPLAWAIATGPAWLRSAEMRAADVLVLDSIAAGAAAPWLAGVRVPVVGMLHQPPGGMEGHHVGRSILAPFDRWAYRSCRVLMVASAWLAQQLAAGGISPDRLRIVVPGKDLGAGQADDAEGNVPSRDALRAGRRMAALCVANWLPRKGILELLEAFAGLPDELATLHLVGDMKTAGGYARRVHGRLARPDLRDRVVVHGLVPAAAVRRMYRAVDVFVLPSFKEPYGTVWGEAMAAGLPVVGWEAGNLPFLADHGRDGLLAPVGDVPALTAAIEQLARDPSLRLTMASAAARRAEARPTWDETAEAFFAVIHEVRTRYGA
jgi:glycosyltransferase involved in cell wall biosynthesis